MELSKKKVGLFLPIPLADALDVMASRVGKKQKWLIVGAALVRLLESSENEQNELIRQVKIADLPGGSFERLISHAKSIAAGGPGFESLVAVDAGQPAANTQHRTNRSGSHPSTARRSKPARR